jgi:hypothetical protein
MGRAYTGNVLVLGSLYTTTLFKVLKRVNPRLHEHLLLASSMNTAEMVKSEMHFLVSL